MEKSANIMASVMPLFLAASMAGCGAIEIRPETNAIAEHLAAQAAVTQPRCDTAYIVGGKEEIPYAERLRVTLNLFTPRQLQVLEKHNVKICLDQRHALTNRGFLGGTLQNVFYPATVDRGAVISLYDSGAGPRDFHSVRQFAEQIVERLEKGDAPTGPVYIDKRLVNCGPMDDCNTEGGMAGKFQRWKHSLRSVESTGLAQRHPELMNPPVLP
jgi:hypothetical protein